MMGRMEEVGKGGGEERLRDGLGEKWRRQGGTADKVSDEIKVPCQKTVFVCSEDRGDSTDTCS